MANTTGPNLGLFVNGEKGGQHYDILMRFLRGIDTLLMPRIKSKVSTLPTTGVADGDAYINLALGADRNSIARWNGLNSSWEFFAPKAAWRVVMLDEQDGNGDFKTYEFDGAEWTEKLSSGGLTVEEADVRYEALVKHNLTATTDPGPDNDSTEGYEVLSRWLNTESGELFIALKTDEGAADWQQSTLTVDELGAAALYAVGSLDNQLPTMLMVKNLVQAYPAFTGSNPGADGIKGFVPAPPASEVLRFLASNGQWTTIEIPDEQQVSAENIGNENGVGLFARKLGNNLQLRKVAAADSSISVELVDDTIVLKASGQGGGGGSAPVNVGNGTGLYAGLDAQSRYAFRSIKGAGDTSVTLEGQTLVVTTNVTLGNLGTGVELYRTGADKGLRSLSPGENVSMRLSDDGTRVIISATRGGGASDGEPLVLDILIYHYSPADEGFYGEHMLAADYIAAYPDTVIDLTDSRLTVSGGPTTGQFITGAALVPHDYRDTPSPVEELRWLFSLREPRIEVPGAPANYPGYVLKNHMTAPEYNPSPLPGMADAQITTFTYPPALPGPAVGICVPMGGAARPLSSLGVTLYLQQPDSPGTSFVPIQDIRIGASEGETAPPPENVGSGAGKVFKGLADNNAPQFRSIAAGDNVTVTLDGDRIVISSAGGAGPGTEYQEYWVQAVCYENGFTQYRKLQDYLEAVYDSSFEITLGSDPVYGGGVGLLKAPIKAEDPSYQLRGLVIAFPELESPLPQHPSLMTPYFSPGNVPASRPVYSAAGQLTTTGDFANRGAAEVSTVDEVSGTEYQIALPIEAGKVPYAISFVAYGNDPVSNDDHLDAVGMRLQVLNPDGSGLVPFYQLPKENENGGGAGGVTVGDEPPTEVPEYAGQLYYSVNAQHLYYARDNFYPTDWSACANESSMVAGHAPWWGYLAEVGSFGPQTLRPELVSRDLRVNVKEGVTDSQSVTFLLPPYMSTPDGWRLWVDLGDAPDMTVTLDFQTMPLSSVSIQNDHDVGMEARLAGSAILELVVRESMLLYLTGSYLFEGRGEVYFKADRPTAPFHSKFINLSQESGGGGETPPEDGGDV